jgi:tRNA (cmo5U34)-methyltransferase
MTGKDSLFSDKKSAVDDFQFTEKVAEVFDDMLGRSVPFYGETIAMAAQLLAKFLKPGSRVYDLGCSTGNTLIELSRRLADLHLHFIGIDNSTAMIHKAILKAEMYSKLDCLNFDVGDIFSVPLIDPAAVVMNYTLQFIRPMHRQDFIKKIYTALPAGGVLIISEKSVHHDPLFNRTYIQLYLDFKRQQGYSEIEISQKREALENVLIPFSDEENIAIMRQAGFPHVDKFFQWFNFSSFVAVKD